MSAPLHRFGGTSGKPSHHRRIRPYWATNDASGLRAHTTRTRRYAVLDHAWQQELASFKALVTAADRQALRPSGLSEDLRSALVAAPARLELALHEAIGDAAVGGVREKARIGARAQSELLPYVLLSRIAERSYAKPRGYAGDFLSIALIYANQPAGVGRLGAALDAGFLRTRAAQAVFGRRSLLADEIRRTVATAGERPAQVTSFASGPAQELLDVYAELPDPAALCANLIDIDQEALDHVAAQIADPQVAKQVNAYAANLIHLAAGRGSVPVEDQDLVYSIGLIDYFDDTLVVSLMDLAYRMLRPGGRLILGNFHPRNPSKALMDHVLDWRLNHRDESDMNRLFEASAFGRPCTAVRYEPQRINLFAECAKP